MSARRRASAVETDDPLLPQAASVATAIAIVILPCHMREP